MSGRSFVSRFDPGYEHRASIVRVLLSELILDVNKVPDIDCVEISSSKRIQAEPNFITGCRFYDPGCTLPVPAPNHAARSVNPLGPHAREATGLTPPPSRSSPTPESRPGYQPARRTHRPSGHGPRPGVWSMASRHTATADPADQKAFRVGSSGRLVVAGPGGGVRGSGALTANSPPATGAGTVGRRVTAAPPVLSGHDRPTG